MVDLHNTIAFRLITICILATLLLLTTEENHVIPQMKHHNVGKLIQKPKQILNEAAYCNPVRLNTMRADGNGKIRPPLVIMTLDQYRVLINNQRKD